MTNQEQYELICEKAEKYDRLVGSLDKIRAEIEQKIEQEDFARSVFRGEEKDTVKVEQCTGSIFAYKNVIRLIDKYKSESERKEEISKDDAIKIVHDTIHDFFVDSETFNDKDELLLKINKAICNNIMGY